MVNEREEMLEQSATIYFGPWYRRSPFFDATRRAGCTAYDVYNHMLLPAYYDDPVVEYWALAERGDRVGRGGGAHGRDLRARRRSLRRLDDLPRPDEVPGEAGQVHDRDRARRRDRERPGPAARRREPLVDAARGLRRRPVRAGRRGAARTSTSRCSYPHAYPMQVQGAMAAKTLEKLVGPAIYDLKYYWCDWFDDRGHPRADQPDGVDGGPRLRDQPARPRPRRRPVGRGLRGGRGVRHPRRSRPSRLAGSRPAS